MLGASTVAHTSRDSPSVTARPPDVGVEMVDVDYKKNEQSMLRYRGSIRTGTRSDRLSGSAGDFIRLTGCQDRRY